MKSTKLKKALAVFLAASMVTSAGLSGTSLVFAGGDTLPPREGEQGYLGENQPAYHGHRAMDVLNWTPETDEYSDFMKADVPLQERNEAFAATQANPTLSQDVKSLSLTEDYGDEFFNPTQYNDLFSQYLFTFWQYQDYRAAWHGTVTNPTPDSLFDPEANWADRDYEFGVLNIPNPAYTNAAHKNGVQSLGCIFFPRAEHTDDWVYQDENGRFPMADKLVEIAKWYGFDGYFINAEERLPADFMPIYEEFCRAMTSQGIYIQVYASNLYGQNNESSWGRIDYYNKDATLFSNWIKGADDDTIAANSLYMNPDPSKSMVDGSVSTMEALGLDPRETVYNTLEAGQTGFSGQRGTLYNLFDENLVPRTGIANLGAGTVWAHLDEQLFGHSGDNSYDEYRRGDPDYQKYIIARERDWWSGSQNGPTYANGKGTNEWADLTSEELQQAVLDSTPNPYDTANDPDRAHTQGGVQSWPGMAAFISERSVINGTDFTTNFNTGHGMQYFVDGEVSNPNEWSNINDQDILPTWQWWSETADDSDETLRFDFDYGTEYNPAFELNQIGGYDGSSSLVAKGSLSVEHFLRLYKTKMDINANSKLDITYYKSTADDASEMKVGLIFEENPNEIVYLSVADSGKQSTEWTTATLDLSGYAGKTLAAFGLAFDPNETAIEDYQMNIGEISITDDQNAPAAPTGLKIDKAFNTTETYLSWDLADYNDVQKYNVYAVFEDGSKVYMGGTYDDNYYVKSLYENTGVVSFEVTAEGKNGVESAAATVSLDLNKAASDLKVESGDGVLNATWSNPADLDYASIRADVTLPYNYEGNTDTFSAEFAKDSVSGTVSVPLNDGSNYYLRLSYLDAEGNVVSYTDISGQLLDDHCDPYEGALTYSTIGNGWKLLNPQVYDWWHINVWNSDGNALVSNGIRGVDNLYNLRLTGNFGYVEVQLEDFSGNLSERTRVYYGANEAAVDENIFPDAALREAVIAQVGDTMEEVLAFDDTLDLSGLDIKDFTGLGYFERLTGINFTNSPVEVISGLDVLLALQNINLTGCKNLQVLDLSNTTIETITCDDPSALIALNSVQLDNARLDLSKGTPEQLFVEAAEEITKDKEDIVISSDEMINYASQANIVAGNSSVFDDDINTYGILLNTSILDVGRPVTISRWELENWMYPAYGVAAFTLEASNDGVTYETVVSQSGIAATSVGDDLEKPVTAQYFRIKVDESYRVAAYVKEFRLVGTDEIIYPAGITYSNQKPVVYYDAQDSAYRFEANSGMVDMHEYAPEAVTIRGTAFDDLKDATFLDPSVDVSAIASGKNLVIKVTHTDGSVTNSVVDTAKLGMYTVTYADESTPKAIIQVDTVRVESDKWLLQKTYEYGLTLSTEGVVDSAVEVFETALAEAKTVLENEYASQEEINTAWDNLLEGIWGLGLVQGDKAMLEQLIARGDSMTKNADKYVTNNWQQLVDALAEAKTVYNDGDALQGDVDAAADALLNAIFAQRYKADKSILEDLINQANEIDTSLYTAESVQAFTAALKSANAVLADESLSEDEQATVDEAVATLSSAMDNLVETSADDNNSGDNNNTGDDANKGDDNTSDKNDTSSKDDPNKGPMDGNKNPATGDNNLIALGALAVLLTSAGAFVVIRRKSRA